VGGGVTNNYEELYGRCPAWRSSEYQTVHRRRPQSLRSAERRVGCNAPPRSQTGGC